MVHRIVFDVQLVQAEPFTETRRADERRESRIESRARLARNRQQLAIAPEILRTALDLFASDLDRSIVVGRLERTEAFLADPQRFGWIVGFTEMTLQTRQRTGTHTSPSRDHPENNL